MSSADEPAREVRFAVVLYGGVSLAVYIHGVVIELLELVRGRGAYGQLAERLDARFVVDVLSGTSAGGINAIFLAKALALDADLDPLREMWIEQGDIELLLNDARSEQGLPPPAARRPPASLLSSRRMFLKLVDALGALKPRDQPRALAAELDLWITATDIAGSDRQLALAERTVLERGHRHVFHLRHPDEHGALTGDGDPLLAFVARCTSSFPVAFEPIALSDLDELVAPGAADVAWYAGFFAPDDRGYRTRAFTDGGVLDNKPFSWPTETLGRRTADLPVDRKLIYVEPSPESVRRTASRRPTAIDAAVAAFELPRKETIAEDLDRIAQRNAAVRRRARVIEAVDDSLTEVVADTPAWLAQTATDAGTLAYERLKIDLIVSDFAALAGVAEPDVAAWFREHHRDLPARRQFLLDLDADYRLRRLRFVLERLPGRDARRDTIRELLAMLRSACEEAHAAFGAAGGDLDAAAGAARRVLRPAFERAAGRAGPALEGTVYGAYEQYDKVLLPLQDGTPGEANVVEVIRISPRDATALRDEQQVGLPKLAGTALANFGAFFAAHWRRNDLLWGRLDAAELIIRALDPDAAELVRERQREIVASELGTLDAATIALIAGPDAVATDADDLLERLGRVAVDPRREGTLEIVRRGGAVATRMLTGTSRGGRLAGVAIGLGRVALLPGAGVLALVAAAAALIAVLVGALLDRTGTWAAGAIALAAVAALALAGRWLRRRAALFRARPATTALIADLHCHYPMHILSGERRPSGGRGVRGLRALVLRIASRIANHRGFFTGPRVSLAALEQGSARIVLSVLYLPFAEMDLTKRYGAPPDPAYFAQLECLIAAVEKDLRDHDPHCLRHEVVRAAAQLDAVLGAGRVAIVHCVEGGFHLGPDPDAVPGQLDTLRSCGVVYVTLAHLFWRDVAKNVNALPFMPDHIYDLLFPQRDGAPLTALGERIVREMHARGVMADISHMRADALRAFWALVDDSVPVIASHAGYRFGAQEYMLDRGTIERIAATGGVVGLILAQHQIRDGLREWRTRSFEQACDVLFAHIEEISEITGGFDHVGIGTDFDGFIKPTLSGLEGPGDLPRLVAPLTARYGTAAAEKILSGNARRVVRRTLERYAG